MQVYHVGEQQRDFRGLTLLAPAVTIGNVGQLAVDLLISTAQLPLVGYLESRHVLPCFGLDAFKANGGPATALELYLDAARGVLVLQQRAPAVTGCQRRFAEELLDWVQQKGLRKVLLLASLDAKFRRDAQLAGPQLCSVATDDASAAEARQHDVPPVEDAAAGDGPEEQRLAAPWPQISAARRRSVPMLSLLAWSGEGDNVADAMRLAAAAARVVGGSTEDAAADQTGGMDWKLPISWQSLFGGSRPEAIY